MYYQLLLKQKSGLLTGLHSDTIFGHFCWRLKERQGEDSLKDFLSLYINGKPVFTVSNAFPVIRNKAYFPIPVLKHLKRTVSAQKKCEKIKDFLNYKDRKSIKYVFLDFFNNFLDGKTEDNIEGIFGDIFKQDLKTGVAINRNDSTAMDGKLFTLKPEYLKTEYFIAVYIKVIDHDSLFDTFQCGDILKDVFYLNYGKKKSSGYGEFEIVDNDLKPFDGFKEATESNCFVSLSNYLPSVGDGISNFSYDMFVKYGKLGEELANSENPFKKPLIMFKPGSTFKTGIKKDFYGRCTAQGEISTTDFVIQNGMAFTLKMRIN